MDLCFHGKKCEARGGFCYLKENFVVSCLDYCSLNSLKTIRPTFKCMYMYFDSTVLCCNSDCYLVLENDKEIS